MLWVPKTTLASFWARKFTSFVAREQLKIPTELAPCAARFRLNPAAATSSASSHVACRKLPFSRISGCVRRAYDPGAVVPLLVMLHGCTQTARGVAVATDLNRLAEEHGFVVVYPQQTTLVPRQPGDRATAGPRSPRRP